jgi:RNA 3'-phosphate cyclase
MLTIDGSYGEGGGQILRTALALSALTRTPFKIEKIRHTRPQPGLKHQHLQCVQALQQLAPARVRGAEIGSTVVEFTPGAVQPGRTVTVDIGTAGSVTLLMQSLLLPAVFAAGDTEIQLAGGTDVPWSMPVDYFSRVVLPHFSDAAHIGICGLRRGFYPKGQGRLGLRVRPRFAWERNMDRRALIRRARGLLPAFELRYKPQCFEIRGVSAASASLKGADVCRRQIEGVKKVVGDRYRLHIAPAYAATASPGSVIVLWAHPLKGRISLASDALGRKGVRAEVIGAGAAKRLLALLESDAALDHHLADNLVPLMALTGGALKPDRITDHILSNIYVCEQFLGNRFEIDARRCLVKLQCDR